MRWFQRILNVLRDDRVQRDIDREMSFHLAERADELQASGLTAEEAQRRARRHFGNVTAQAERTRDMDLAGSFEAALRNLRYSVRTLAKTPGFTATVVLTLALGIGANTAVFSAIHAVLLRPLPFPESDHLVEIRQSHPKSAIPLVSPPRLKDWRRMNSSFQAITGYYTQDSSELSGDLPEKLKQAFVAPGFVEVWGVAPALGRSFTASEETFGGPQAVIISDRFWRRRFAADPSALRRHIRLNSRTGTVPIVGIMPASFLFPDREVDLWSPTPLDAPYAQERAATWFTTIGRLKPSFSVAQAQADLATVQANLARQYPKHDAEIQVNVRPLKDATVGSARLSLRILFGSVTLLLILACTNIAALLLSRSTQRRQEIAVRFSLGATRRSVVVQLLTESFLLCLGGALLGLWVAYGASSMFRTLAAKLPRVDEIVLDWRILLYTLVCALAATLLCGIYPAIRSTRREVSAGLSQGGRAQVSGHSPVHLSLVGIQVCLAVTLLIGAGLLVRSFHELSRVSPGFDPSRVLTFHMSASWSETTDSKGLQQRTERTLDHLRAVPGIQGAALAMAVPGVPTEFQHELIIDQKVETEPKVIAESRFVSRDYFAVMGVPLLAGELCRNTPGPTPVAVNRSFVTTYFGGGSAIGHQLRRVESDRAGEIRAIVGDARELGIDRAPVPTVYWCYEAAQPNAVFLVRTHGDPMAMAQTVRRKLFEIEPRRSVFDLSPLEERISEAYAQNRLRTFLLSFFALTAVSLASVGLYGTLSYLVSIRRREIGLRLALGAVRGQIARHFLARGLGVSLLGCLAGMGLAAAFTRLLSGMLYGVSRSDTITLFGVVIIIGTVSVAGSLLPALRAARLDPMQVLRDQ